MSNNLFNSYQFILLVPFVILILFGISVGLRMSRKEKEILMKLAGQLNGSMPRFSLYRSLRGQYQGVGFLIKLIPAGKHTPPYLAIDLYKRSAFKLNVYEESGFTNFAKKLGFLREVKVGDEAFDKRLMISSNKPDDAALFLLNTDKRNAINRIFDQGFKSFVINGKSVAILKPYYALERDLGPDFIKEVLRLLNLIATGLMG